MTALSDHCNTIRDWVNLGSDVYPDSVVTSWIRMSESILSKELRCKEMLQIDTGLLFDQRLLLPSDWRQLDFVRIVDGRGLRYVPRDDFYNPDLVNDQENCYTLSGDYLICGGVGAEGLRVELHYYQDLPPLGDTITWPLVKYPMLLTLKPLAVGSTYAFEDERGDRWEAQSAQLIDDINEEHRLSKASGSRLTARRRRSFG